MRKQEYSFYILVVLRISEDQHIKAHLIVGFLLLCLIRFNNDLRLNQVACRQTPPPEMLLLLIVKCLRHLHIN